MFVNSPSSQKKYLFKDFKSSKKLLAILFDPDKIDINNVAALIAKLPKETTHIFVGGSTVEEGVTQDFVQHVKKCTVLPVLLFPGDYSQITEEADALLFLSLLSGRNHEFIIGQHIKSIPKLIKSSLEIIPTAYLLIDGGKETAVERVSQTKPIPQENIEEIVHIAKAGELLGKKLIYLEAGSGASFPVNEKIIQAVTNMVRIPVIVGGGIRTANQIEAAYRAGAKMVVIGTAFEENIDFLSCPIKKLSP